MFVIVLVALLGLVTALAVLNSVLGHKYSLRVWMWLRAWVVTARIRLDRRLYRDLMRAKEARWEDFSDAGRPE